MTDQQKTIEAQKGFQWNFLSCSADIIIGGAKAGVGKTYALLLDPLRYMENPDFGAVIFRRTSPMIRNEGGLWDTSMAVYPDIGATPKESVLEWQFPSGARLKFSHLEHEKDKLNWQGAQVPWIGFDELTQFTEGQFFYLLGRNRSACGVQPCVRATCNPDTESWVATFVEWFIDQDPKSPSYGLPIPERCGQLRYFTRDGKALVWGSTKAEVIEKCPHLFEKAVGNPEDMILSMTLLPGDIYENIELLKKNPQYLGNLMALDEAEKSQLLGGNWKVKQDGMALGQYGKIESIFTNHPPAIADDPNKITCDVARFGKDLAVIATWVHEKAARLDIYTTSALTVLHNQIEANRAEFSVSVDDVLIDQDGIGGGLVDSGGYHGFSGGATAMEDPATQIKENYKNLKTQCAYRFFAKVNLGNFAVDPENIWIDGEQTTVLHLGGKEIDVLEYIRKQLRCIKRKNADQEGKKQINSKEEQKNALNGASPDFFDTFMMKSWFDLRETADLEFIEF